MYKYCPRIIKISIINSVFWAVGSTALALEPLEFATPIDISDGGVVGVSALDADDLNGDGFVDIVAIEGGYHANGRSTFAWFQSPRTPQGKWLRHDFNRPSAWRHFTGAVRITDIDQDGDKDVVVAMDNHSVLPQSAYIYWLENPGHSEFGTGNWKVHTVVADMPVEHINDMAVADIDNDGKPDVVVRSLEPNRIIICFNDLNKWTLRHIDTTAISSTGEGFALGDLDRDGRIDISINGFWLKNPIDARIGAFTRYGIDSQYARINSNTKEVIGFINDDPYPDLVISPAEGFRDGANHQLVWYEGVKNPSAVTQWRRHVILNDVNGRHAVALADIDGDHNLDLISGSAWNSWGQQKQIDIFYNTSGDGQFSQRQTLKGGKGLYTLVVKDLFNDGDLDIIGPDTYSQKASPFIYLSQLSDKPFLSKLESPVISPKGVTFGSSISVKISSNVEFAKLFYTLDGSMPTINSLAYIAPIVLTRTTTLKAIAVIGDRQQSEISQANFVQDIKGPKLIAVKPYQSGNTLALEFDEKLAAAAVTPDNFTVSNGIKILKASVQANFVELKITTLRDRGPYQLTYKSLADQYGNESSELQGTLFNFEADSEPNLLAHWSMDETMGRDVVDQSDYGNSGTVIGGAWVKGKVGNALKLKGGSDIATFNPLHLSGEALTITAWINAKNFDETEGRIIAQTTGDETSDHDFMLSTYKRDGFKIRLRLKTNGVTSTVIADDSHLSAGVWTHVAAVYDGHKITIYQDGFVVGQQAQSGSINFNPNAALTIGNSPTLNKSFEGSIDEVLVFARALDAQAIRQLSDSLPGKLESLPVVVPAPKPMPAPMPTPTTKPLPPAIPVVVVPPMPMPKPLPAPAPQQAPTPDVASGLIGYWSMDNLVGTIVADESTAHRNGTVVGASLAAGQFGQSLNVSGGNYYMKLPPIALSGKQMTISLWLNARDFSNTEGRLISQASGVANDDHYYMLSTIDQGGIKLRFRLKIDGKTITLVGDGENLPINKWVHVVAVYNGNDMSLYKDGVLVGQLTHSGNITSGGKTMVDIGRNPDGSRYFSGLIDEVRIYQRALSLEQIKCLSSKACAFK